MLRIDARSSREIQATVLSFRTAGRELRRAITARVRQDVAPLWRTRLASRTRTTLERRVLLPGARAAITGDGIRVYAATSRRPLPNGLIPAEDWPALEFGARNVLARYRRRSPQGREHIVNRTLNRQFPGRVREGRIAFETASEIGTELVAATVIALVTTYREAVNQEGA